jgi:hypothetical protein
MPSANGFGIQALTGTLVESVEISYDSETKTLMDREGNFSEAKLMDTSIGFTVRGGSQREGCRYQRETDANQRRL